jgi:hypothetical protein
VPWSSTSLSQRECWMIRPLTLLLMTLLIVAMYLMNGVPE